MKTINQKHNIFLIGMMGTGKTTIGKKLAKQLQMVFYDSDEEIEKHTRASIAWIFELEGEKKFREREAKMIDRLTQHKGIVLATGGGAVLRADNRQHLKSRGIVIHLHTSIDILIKRVRPESRPLLAQSNLQKVLPELIVQRQPLYEEIAEFSYDTGKSLLQDVVKQIIVDLRNKHYFN